MSPLTQQMQVRSEKRMGLGSGVQRDTYGRVISNRSSISSDEITAVEKGQKFDRLTQTSIDFVLAAV